MGSSSPTPRSAGLQHRLATMAEPVLDRGIVSMGDVAQRYGASMTMVCRDPAALEAGGIVERARGRVMARATSCSEASAAFRGAIKVEIKARLAERAVADVHAWPAAGTRCP